MNNAPIHSRKRFLVNLAPGHNRSAWHIAAAQRFRERDDVRFQIPMLESEHFSGATEPGLHFIGNEQRAVLATKFLRAREEIGIRCLAAFPLNGFDHEGDDVTRAQLSI